MQSGHVRLLAALMAAGGLHALLLFWPTPTVRHSLHNGALHLDLLDRQAAAVPRRRALQSVQPRREQPVKLHPHSSGIRKGTVYFLPPSRDFVPRQSRNLEKVKLSPFYRMQTHHSRGRSKPSSMLAVRADRKPSLFTHVSRAHQRNRVTPAKDADVRFPIPATAQAQADTITDEPSPPVPARTGHLTAQAQSMLLASIAYPRLARRRGWQGKGEFQLLVARKNVRKVNVLASTGYRLLDQAARRGLLAVRRVSLDDGMYKLPVEFRLQ